MAWDLREGPRNHHGDVILLFAGAELVDGSNDCLEQWTYRKMTIGAKGFEGISGCTKA